ncbi:unnamed protein product [Fusarium equiseti]|uniref:Uncharacterized protein n=1 Tax=Fusarium equiseti TaxID=61235 RepID=A0A8J2IM48_FUSEQ|nr:unnamed protein product [Fusarium equiseti]
MISTSFFTGALAIIAVNGVSAGPCRPSTIATTETTVTVGSASTETSIETSEATTLTLSTTADVPATTTELSTISEDVSSAATSFDDTTTLISITTTTTQEVQDSTTVPATTTTTAAAEVFACTTNADCETLNGGANPFCDVGSCVADNSQGSPCSDDSDCTTPGETCSADGFCGPPITQPGESCSDKIDCLLSLDPLCALGLCVCLDTVCSPPSGHQSCTTAAKCDAGQSCQQAICVDDVSCSSEGDCVANLDLCTSLGICACVNGICRL